MTDRQILEASENRALEYQQRATLAERALKKKYCVLLDNSLDGFEMGGFFETQDEALLGTENQNYQLWEISTGELLEELPSNLL